ncbi:MAG: hypothetical protein QXR44_00785 [Thermoproteota archaeon]
MPSRIIIVIAIILALISAFSAYQYYNRTAEDALRSKRISLLISLNLTDYKTVVSFDNKYNYLAIDNEYNRTVLEFFKYWCLNQSLAEEYLNTFKNIEEANDYLSEYYAKPKRLSFLIKHANATELEAMLFDKEYNYLATGNEYNRTVLEFFKYWRANSSLASLCLNILQDVKETNNYLSGLERAVINLFSGEDLSLILSVCTDKDEYLLTGDEKVRLTIILLSNRDLGDVAIDIFGFKSRYRGYVVNNKWIDPTGILKIPVRRGLNSKTFNIEVPCSPCYVIQSGLNNLTCVIKYNSLRLSVTKTFLLKSGS